MNTIRSTWIGWGVLCFAGAGAYYFAKKEIDADKQAKFENQQRRQHLASQLETHSMYSNPPKKKGPVGKSDPFGNPAAETTDVAPAEHVEARTRERSKYEPTEVYRTKKGDRFS